MTTELGRRKSPLSATLAVQKSMQSFFHGWLEDDKLQKEWSKRKEVSRNKIVKFLQENSSILFQEKKAEGGSWIEQSIKNLEELEKAQLGQRFLTANTSWNSYDERQVITLPQESSLFKAESMESTVSETMIFMPEISQNKNLHIDITDILRKGLTNTRALLNIMNLSEKSLNDESRHTLESQLQIFKQQINVIYQSHKNQQQKNNHKAMKDAVKAYEIFSEQLAAVLVAAGLYAKESDACQGIVHMADFLWSKNYEKSSIYIQHASKDQASMLVFEPRSVKGSGNKEALWIKRLARKHPWVKRLPWQVLERPRPSMNRDGEGLKIEKTTLVSVRKSGQNTQLGATTGTKEAGYVVDCTPMGELGGIPVPFAMCDLAERYRITLENQKEIFLGSKTRNDKPPFYRLEEVVFNQMDILKAVMTKARQKKGITIPLADINLAQRIFPYKNAGAGWLQDRADANKVVRQVLQRYVFYYNEQNMQCAYLDKTAENFFVLQQTFATENYIPIHVEFHDPTIVYNNFKAFSYRTSEDIEGLKAGIRVAIERLEIFKEKLLELHIINQAYQQDVKDIGVIQKFLQSRAVGLFQPQGIADSIILVARRLSEKLRDTQYSLLDDAYDNRKVQIEILKILQSSLIVKDESFESVFGFLRRMVDNFFIDVLFIMPENKCFRNFLMANTQFSKTVWGLLCLLVSPLFIIGWSARLSLTLCAAIIKIPAGICYGLRSIVGKSQNKSERLAAATGILFSTAGKKKLNFKSTIDCALPVVFMIYAMINRAIYGEPVNGKVPLMTECNKQTIAKDMADATIKHRQILKTVGLVGS